MDTCRGRGLESAETVRFKVWSPEQQQQHHPGICYLCELQSCESEALGAGPATTRQEPSG